MSHCFHTYSLSQQSVVSCNARACPGIRNGCNGWGMLAASRRHVTLLLPRLEELNTDCSVLQGLLPHVVSLIQQGKEVPSGFSLLESYLLIGGPSVLAPVRGEIASVLQQTAERVLVAMSPREARIALWLRSAFCASQLRSSRRCWECQAVLLHGLLRRQVTASHFVGLALLLSACLIQQVATQPCPNMRPRRRCTAQSTPTAAPKSCC